MEISNDISTDMLHIMMHIDSITKKINVQNNENNEKIIMYKTMMENVIESYYDLCKVMYNE